MVLTTPLLQHVSEIEVLRFSWAVPRAELIATHPEKAAISLMVISA
jgi:hypothetical protein